MRRAGDTANQRRTVAEKKPMMRRDKNVDLSDFVYGASERDFPDERKIAEIENS